MIIGRAARRNLLPIDCTSRQSIYIPQKVLLRNFWWNFQLGWVFCLHPLSPSSHSRQRQNSCHFGLEEKCQEIILTTHTHQRRDLKRKVLTAIKTTFFFLFVALIFKHCTYIKRCKAGEQNSAHTFRARKRNANFTRTNSGCNEGTRSERWEQAVKHVVKIKFENSLFRQQQQQQRQSGKKQKSERKIVKK